MRSSARAVSRVSATCRAPRLLVGVEGGSDAAAGEVLGGLALPGFGLAADGLEAGRGLLLEESSVGVSGTDRLELVGIAEQDDLGVVGGGVVEDARELAGVDHAGLVDDQDDAAVEGLLAAAPGVLPAVEGAGGDAGLLLQGVGGLAGQGGADDVVAGVAVGLGDGRRGGGLAGTGAADDESKVVAGGGGEDGAPLLFREVGHAVEGALDVLGIETELVAGGELAGGGEEPRLITQVVGRGVAGDAAGVLADDDGLVTVDGQPGDRPAVALMEGGALDVGLGEGRAGRGDAVDERRGALGRGRAGEGRQLAVAGLALDLRRLGVPLAVLAEGLAEAGGKLGAAQVAVDLRERDTAAAVGHHQAGAALGRLEAEAELGEAGLELDPASGLGEDVAGLLADAVGQGRDAGAHRLADGAGVEVGGRLVAAGAAQAVLDLDGGDGFVGVDHVAEGSPGAAVVADAVDDDVDVLVVGVAVGEEDGLVVGEAHAGEDAAGGLLPLLAGEVLALGEAQAEVVDGLLDPGVLAGCVAHQLGCLGRVVGVEVAGAGPGDPGRVGAVAVSLLQVADEAGEAAAEAGPGAGRGFAAALEGGHPRGSSWRARRRLRSSPRTRSTVAWRSSGSGVPEWASLTSWFRLLPTLASWTIAARASGQRAVGGWPRHRCRR